MLEQHTKLSVMILAIGRSAAELKFKNDNETKKCCERLAEPSKFFTLREYGSFCSDQKSV